jgi:hypothetical protein
MAKTWREVNRYKIVNGDGATEELVLERNDEGIFRLRNDFGNSVFEFDVMTGAEFTKRLRKDVVGEIDDDLEILWDNLPLLGDDDDETTDPGNYGGD